MANKANNIKVNIPEIIAVVCGVIGLAVYWVTSTTGYLAGQGVNAAVLACGAVAVVALIAKITLGSRLVAGGVAGGVLADLLLVGSEVLMIVAFAFFVLARVRLAADIYFIPVNYPAAEETALNISLIGVVAYAVAIIALIVKAFAKDRVAAGAAAADPRVAVIPA
ncbi:sodium:proton antiporter [Bifidobacterium ramosum]|uniref:Sodium:proton antiporter n=1 Tax=Bifidobacterium ramosum TaxID=1798158 RepID=A0A6L4WXK2_9BIFI|nr:hypothetical protein [Bifidobacterium ramosum]KAB8286638.1 sodium:proton antiporter [Bifidobacterium ramosum]